MKIRCKENDPDKLSFGIPSDFDYGLIIDKEYTVVGILYAGIQVWYLIDENGKPGYYPNQLFEITSSVMSSIWHFKNINDEDGIYPIKKKILIGYYELCFDKNHYEELVDRKFEALSIYHKRKIEIENNLDV